jgi:asparagine synthase (glutamine-hydrolysing)
MDGFNVFLISKVVKREGIVVALSGQGGDELFGGYPSFADVPRLCRWFRCVRAIPRGSRRALAAVAMIARPATVRSKAIDIADCNGSLLSLYLRRRRVMSSRQLRAMGLVPEALSLTDDYMPPEGIDEGLFDPPDAVWGVSRLETRFYLGNMLLRDGDANSMRHSLEIRVPLLDQRLLDLVLPLPGVIRLPTGRADKHLLRRAFPELLRPALLRQKKKGFMLPIDRWMRGPLRDLCETGLRVIRSLGIVDPTGVDAVWRIFSSDRGGAAWSRAFTLCVLGLYLQRTGASV